MAEKINPLSSVMDQFHGICPGVEFSVLFSCGECCFKATDVADIDICDDVAILKARQCDLICIFPVTMGRGSKEVATAVAIPLENICAIEAQPPECRHREE